MFSSGGGSRDRSGSVRVNYESNDESLSELQLWSFDFVQSATKSFSDSNLVGEGGFGPVYKVSSTSLKLHASKD